MDSVDTFSALQQALNLHVFHQEEEGASSALPTYNWGLPLFAARHSDSALCDEDWVERQHRARQESLAGTFADALTISALSTVKQRVQTLIGGDAQKWKPPKFDIPPDHGDLLEPKLSRQQRAQRERNRDRAVHRKPGPVEIGRMKDFKMPIYVGRARAESPRYRIAKGTNSTFLDRDRSWYSRPKRTGSHQQSGSSGAGPAGASRVKLRNIRDGREERGGAPSVPAAAKRAKVKVRRKGADRRKSSKSMDQRALRSVGSKRKRNKVKGSKSKRTAQTSKSSKLGKSSKSSRPAGPKRTGSGTSLEVQQTSTRIRSQSAKRIQNVHRRSQSGSEKPAQRRRYNRRKAGTL